MRSSEALMRSALTTMRRSLATGDWRAKIAIACSSNSLTASSMALSRAITDSASVTSDLLNASTASVIEVTTRPAMVTSRSWTSCSSCWNSSRMGAPCWGVTASPDSGPPKLTRGDSWVNTPSNRQFSARSLPIPGGNALGLQLWRLSSHRGSALLWVRALASWWLG